MLTDAQVTSLREVFTSCSHPLIFFHDDPDGLASYVMVEHFIGGGRGIVVKAHPHITAQFLNKVEELAPDVVIVLDIALVDQEFIDGCKMPVVWVDHHEPQQRERVQYMNPRVDNGPNVPTPALIYQVTQQDLWLATLGAIGDWYLPPFAKEFSKQFPTLLPQNVKSVEQALFDTPLAPLIKLFSFILKGPTTEVNKSVHVLTKIESPLELAEQSTSRAKMLWRKYLEIDKFYQSMLQNAFTKIDANDKLLVFTYHDDKLSLTKDLANEMLYRYGKVILLGRERHGEIRCSLRSPHAINIKVALEKALVGVEGYGGGHENACGAAIKKEDFARFVDNLRRELGI